MKNKKKKLISILLAISCLFVVVLVTLAAADNAEYYTTARNFVTTDGVHIVLAENFGDDAGGSSGKRAANEKTVVGVMPGVAVKKEVWVENQGAQAWIRIRLDKKITLADGTPADPDLMELDINEQDWSEMDGWYYYRLQLDPQASTSMLFTKVTFSADMDNTYQGSTAEITVYAQAVQTAHNGQAATRASGWPEDSNGNSGQLIIAPDEPGTPINPDPGNNGGGDAP